MTKIIETKKLYVVVTNSDLTEGKGYEYPLAVCESPITANRLGKGKYVQGSDCDIKEITMINISSNPYPQWYVERKAVNIIEMNQEDKDVETLEKMKAEHHSAVEKAKALGLSENEILAIRYNPTNHC